MKCFGEFTSSVCPILAGTTNSSINTYSSFNPVAISSISISTNQPVCTTVCSFSIYQLFHFVMLYSSYYKLHIL